MKTLQLIGALVLGGVTLVGAPITVHNTGVDATDTLVAAGGSTSFWTLTAQPGASQVLGTTPFRYFNGAYVADTATAAWVSPGSNGNAGNGGIYTYTLTVDLSGFDPNTAVITGRFSSDNSGSLFLNNNAAAATRASADFSSFASFTLNSGFVAGLNTINVSVNNQGDPTAFIVEFSSATADPIRGGAVPEPSTYALMAAGLAAVVARRRQQGR